MQNLQLVPVVWPVEVVHGEANGRAHHSYDYSVDSILSTEDATQQELEHRVGHEGHHKDGYQKPIQCPPGRVLIHVDEEDHVDEDGAKDWVR